MVSYNYEKWQFSKFGVSKLIELICEYRVTSLNWWLETKQPNQNFLRRAKIRHSYVKSYIGLWINHPAEAKVTMKTKWFLVQLIQPYTFYSMYVQYFKNEVSKEDCSQSYHIRMLPHFWSNPIRCLHDATLGGNQHHQHPPTITLNHPAAQSSVFYHFNCTHNWKEQN